MNSAIQMRGRSGMGAGMPANCGACNNQILPHIKDLASDPTYSTQFPIFAAVTRLREILVFRGFSARILRDCAGSRFMGPGATGHGFPLLAGKRSFYGNDALCETAVSQTTGDDRPLQFFTTYHKQSSCRATRQNPQVRCASPRGEGSGTSIWYRVDRDVSGIRRPCISSLICGGLSYIGINGSETNRSGGAVRRNVEAAPPIGYFERRA